MVNTSLFTTLWTFLALALQARSVHGVGSGGIKLDFQIKRGDEIADIFLEHDEPYIMKRDGVEVSMRNRRTFYLAELEVGSNEDKVGTLVDTGSSDLWIMGSGVDCRLDRSYKKRNVIILDNEVLDDEVLGNEKDLKASKTIKGEAKQAQSIDSSYYTNPFAGDDSCTGYGSFSTSGSDSFRLNSSAPRFSIQYLDGTTATGVYGRDTVGVGNSSVENLSFAVVNVSSSDISVLGIGLPGLQTTYSGSNLNAFSNRYTYENLPMRMRSQGLINRAAYSLYLGQKYASAGTLLFGAVDTEKFNGNLLTVPIINTLRSRGYDTPIRMEVELSSISFNNSENEAEISGSPYSALLDSGTTLTFLPTNLLQIVGESIGGTYNSRIGLYSVPCTSDPNVFFVLNFSGAKIRVPLADLLLSSGSSCYLGLLNLQDDYILVGDNVLRSAYIVYDIDNLEISLAQARYTEDENIVEIQNSIPSALAITNSPTNVATSFSHNTASTAASTTLSYSSGTYQSSTTSGATSYLNPASTGASGSNSTTTGGSQNTNSANTVDFGIIKNFLFVCAIMFFLFDY